MNNKLVNILLWSLLHFALNNGEENRLQESETFKSENESTDKRGEGRIKSMLGDNLNIYDGTQEEDKKSTSRDFYPLAKLINLYLKHPIVGRTKVPTTRSLTSDKSSNLHSDIDWDQENDLTSTRHSENGRRTRSINEKDATILAEIEEILEALKQHLDDPERYRELVAIMRDVQRQLLNSKIAPTKDTFIKSIIKSYMKRRFNSWGGKRTAEFNAWGGRKKKSVDYNSDSMFHLNRDIRGFNAWGGRKKKSVDYDNDRIFHLNRDIRGFNAWGGKRSLDRKEHDLDSFEKGKSTVSGRPDSTIFINLDIGSAEAEAADRQATLRKLFDGVQNGGFIRSRENPAAAFMYYGTAKTPTSIDHDYEKKAFDAWGGKRSGLEDTGDHDEMETLTLTKETSNKDIKRKTFNQWGGK